MSPPNGEGSLAGEPSKAESKSRGQLSHVAGSDKQIVRLPLTAAQAQRVASLVLGSAKNSQNVIFCCCALPHWSCDEQSVIWELEVTSFSARLGQKIRKLILGSSPA
jgi:hypothetical protein